MQKKILCLVISFFILFSGNLLAGIKTKAFIAGGSVAVKHVLKSPKLRKAIIAKAKNNTAFKEKSKSILVKFWKNPKNKQYKDKAKSLYKDIVGIPQKVKNRNPLNHKYAGKTYKLDTKSAKFKKYSKSKQRELIEIQRKYPDGIPFNINGFPDFSRYAIKKVDIKYTGKRINDFDLANAASGLKRTPKNYTWHHHENGKTMQLIPTDLHELVRHTGGFAK